MIRNNKSISPVFRISVMVLLVSFVCSDRASSQLKIYVNTDLEGVSGVFKFNQTRKKGTPLNIQACEYFMEDLAAVVRGFATEVQQKL